MVFVIDSFHGVPVLSMINDKYRFVRVTSWCIIDNDWAWLVYCNTVILVCVIMRTISPGVRIIVNYDNYMNY